MKKSFGFLLVVCALALVGSAQAGPFDQVIAGMVIQASLSTPTPTPYADSQVGKDNVIEMGLNATGDAAVGDAVKVTTNGYRANKGAGASGALVGKVVAKSGLTVQVRTRGVIRFNLTSSGTAPEIGEPVLCNNGKVIDAEIAGATTSTVTASLVRGIVLDRDTTNLWADVYLP